MNLLILVEGFQFGLLTGAAICVRYLRREISADIGPQLRRIRGQLDTLEAAVNLALMTRYADLSEGAARVPSMSRAPESSGK